jgi:hypothetical protein
LKVLFVMIAMTLISFLCSLWFVSCAEMTEKSAPLTVSGKASFTYYQSYPMCCPDSPNYDPAYPTEECDDYSGCVYMGDLAAFQSDSNPDGYVPIQYEMTHNLVAFYDNNDPKGHTWKHNYANKTIQITKTYNGVTHVFNASIADTCGNGDCNNCCAKNSQPSGYLVDMEYYTLMNNFGTTDAADGTLDFIVFP